MKTRKIHNFNDYTNLSKKKKAIKEKLNATIAERVLKKKEAKGLTVEIITLKRQLKTVVNKIG